MASCSLSITFAGEMLVFRTYMQRFMLQRRGRYTMHLPIIKCNSGAVERVCTKRPSIVFQTRRAQAVDTELLTHSNVFVLRFLIMCTSYSFKVYSSRNALCLA